MTEHPQPGPTIGRLEARVHGRVQGVGFRYFVLIAARDLGLEGWVANDHDGSVHVVAEGDEAALALLQAGLEEGPPASVVERVVAHRFPAAGMEDGFRIKSGAHCGD